MSNMKRHNNNNNKNRSFKNGRKSFGQRSTPNVAQNLQRSKQAKEKYLQLARESLAAGDRIQAENYFQHADHYTRVINSLSREREESQPAAEAQPAEEAVNTESEKAVETEAGNSNTDENKKPAETEEFLPAFLLAEV